MPLDPEVVGNTAALDDRRAFARVEVDHQAVR
jgi:hypothetical protein